MCGNRNYWNAGLSTKSCLGFEKMGSLWRKANARNASSPFSLSVPSPWSPFSWQPSVSSHTPSLSTYSSRKSCRYMLLYYFVKATVCRLLCHSRYAHSSGAEPFLTTSAKSGFIHQSQITRASPVLQLVATQLLRCPGSNIYRAMRCSSRLRQFLLWTSGQSPSRKGGWRRRNARPRALAPVLSDIILSSAFGLQVSPCCTHLSQVTPRTTVNSSRGHSLVAFVTSHGLHFKQLEESLSWSEWWW